MRVRPADSLLRGAALRLPEVLASALAIPLRVSCDSHFAFYGVHHIACKLINLLALERGFA